MKLMQRKWVQDAPDIVMIMMSMKMLMTTTTVAIILVVVGGENEVNGYESDGEAVCFMWM